MTREKDRAAGEAAHSDDKAPDWAGSILPAPSIASRQWSHAFARRCREPAQVAGFIQPSAEVHHIVMATEVGFQLEARELGAGRAHRHEIAPGELCLNGAGGSPTELGWRSRGRARTLEVVELYVDPAGLHAEGVAQVQRWLEPGFRALRDPLLGELLRSLAGELSRPESGDELFGDLAVALFAARLERAHGVAGPHSSVRRGGLAPFALKRVREYVAAHLGRRIRLEQLAALAGLSQFHFSRAFKASLGLSPHAYVLRCRIDEAKRQLSRSSLSVSEIARRTGFSDTSQLSTRFRAFTGVTPSRFRSLSRG